MMSHTAEAAEPILPPDQSLGDVTDQIARIPLNFPTRGRWLLALGVPRMQLDTLRLRLIKIGGWVRQLLTQVRLHLAESHPGRPLWDRLAARSDRS